MGQVELAEKRVDTPTQCRDTVPVTNVGEVDMEEYLAGVVACEMPADAPLEARKAQAIAARTYTYRYLGNSSSICNSQSCQVYKCSHRPNGPSEADYQAVRETSGQVLTNGGKLTCPFFVAGDPNTSGPDCKGTVSTPSGANGYEKHVTYNEGMSGDDATPSTQGHPANPDNRGSMSQNGAACLANQGKSAAEILDFYYDNALTVDYLPGGDCGELPQNCFGNSDTESCGSNVCAWNGQTYCCREPGFGGELCFTDAECSGGLVCAYNGEDFVCTQPSCAAEEEGPEDPEDPEDPAEPESPVKIDDTKPAQDESHRPSSESWISELTDLFGSCAVSSVPVRGTSSAAWVLIGGMLLVVRRRRQRRRVGLVAASAAMLALGCSTSGGSSGSRAGGGSGGSSGGGGGSGGTGASGSCEQLTVESFQASSTQALFAITSPNKGEASNDFLSIEFFPPSGKALSTGTFDLSSEGDYASCTHCVRLDQDDKSEAKRVFFAETGTLELSAVGVMPSVSAGTLKQVKLVEVAVDPSTYQTTPVADGACYLVDSATWDTRPAVDPGSGGAAGSGVEVDGGTLEDSGTQTSDSVCSGLADCQKCCVNLHQDAAAVLTTHALSCICNADVCQAECASTLCGAVPSTADEDCVECTQFMFSGSNRCADEVRTVCEQDPECAPVMECFADNECAYLP